MSLRKVWEKEILIRLTANGFVETIRRFGRESSFTYEVNECVLAPVLVKRDENRRTGNAS